MNDKIRKLYLQTIQKMDTDDNKHNFDESFARAFADRVVEECISEVQSLNRDIGLLVPNPYSVIQACTAKLKNIIK
jgi:hypothetical protein